MRRNIAATVLTAAFAVSMSISALAGQWQQDTTGWWYQNEDGSYYSNGWNWIDGKCYYFDASGYMLANTTTPDGYTVDGTGAWIVDGVVQMKDMGTQAAEEAQPQQQVDSEIPNVAGTYVGSGITCVIVDEGNNRFWSELSGLEKDYLPTYIGNGIFEIPGYIRYIFSGNTLTVEYVMDGETYQMVKQ